jgi:hypothetical protein
LVDIEVSLHIEGKRAAVREARVEPGSDWAGGRYKE